MQMRPDSDRVGTIPFLALTGNGCGSTTRLINLNLQKFDSDDYDVDDDAPKSP
jgi:hypothetical protein